MGISSEDIAKTLKNLDVSNKKTIEAARQSQFAAAHPILDCVPSPVG